MASSNIMPHSSSAMLRSAYRAARSFSHAQFRSSSSTSSPTKTRLPKASVGKPVSANELRELLSKPSWSVSELLAPRSSSSNEPPPSTHTSGEEEEEQITPAKLHHLLRLSALPLPSSAAEEKAMISTLEEQLQFVRKVQEVDTTGVEPLVVIRDERAASRDAAAVTVADLKHVFDAEEQVGRYRRIVKKKDNSNNKNGTEEKSGSHSQSGSITPTPQEGDGSEPAATMNDDLKWDPLERAPHKVGRFIKVNTETS